MLSGGSRSAAETTLLEPKLALPSAPPHFVHRPRLTGLLDDGADRRVTLVVGPAGYGKTVLVSDWLSHTPGRSVGWVSLDVTDDAPSRFWTYVVAALARGGVEVPDGRSLIATAGSVPPAEALGSLVNVLARIDHEVFLVLDDFHLITDPVIHRDVAFLVDQQLRCFHLVLLSRNEPPLASARWKAHGQVTQVRARHLAFSREEATTYLHGQGVFLSSEIWESLYSRVEGWVAALQLVALWSVDQDDNSEAITQFAAGDVSIADYLTTEVLSGLPQDLRRFLLWTSILPRLNGALCDAVTGDSSGAATLRDLFQRGLFLESLDAAHQWLRYHQLFAELLRNELQRDHPEIVTELHRRASTWCQANGQSADAIDHSIRAADWESVQRLMLGEVLLIGARYEPAVVERWLDRIPADVLRASPFFQLMYAFVLGHTARLVEAQRGIDRATELMAVSGPDSELPELGALVSVVAAGIARLNCDLVAAKARAQEVESSLRQTGRGETDLARMSRAAAGISLATTLFFNGEVADAERQVVATARWTDDQFLVRMHANGTGTRALILATTGRVRHAEQVAREALDTAASVGITELFQANCALLAAAVIAVERGHNAAAVELLDALAARADRHADRGVQFITAVHRAQLMAVGGDANGGLEILDRQRSRWPDWTPPTSLSALADAAEIQLRLKEGDAGAASIVLARLSARGGPLPTVVALRHLSAGRVLGVQRRFAESLTSLAAAERSAGSAGLGSLRIRAVVQAASIQRARGREGTACETLQRALLLAQDEGIVAPFLDLGRSVRPLLLAIDNDAGEFASRGIRHDLLARLGVPAPATPPTKASSTSHRLTDRELTVLRLLSGDLTGTEIADSLGISANTLKTHTRQIYSKLGVNNRHDAVRQAAILSSS